jgi:hypothetical protein
MCLKKDLLSANACQIQIVLVFFSLAFKFGDLLSYLCELAAHLLVDLGNLLKLLRAQFVHIVER